MIFCQKPSKRLKKVGVNDVETAVDGRDAWEKIQSSERPFDSVLTDIWMPNMNGRSIPS